MTPPRYATASSMPCAWTWLVPDLGSHVTHAYVAEVLSVAPSKWYLTGFLVPYEAPADQRSDDDSDDGLDQVNRAVEGDDDNTPEATSARKAFFPSSMGLSVLVPRDTTKLQVRISWADYAPMVEGEGDTAERCFWRRGNRERVTLKARAALVHVCWAGGDFPREAEVPVALEEGDPESTDIPDVEGLKVVVSVRPDGRHRPCPGRLPVGLRFPGQPAAAGARHDPRCCLCLSGRAVVARREALRCPVQTCGAGTATTGTRRWPTSSTPTPMEYAVGHNISAVAVIDADRPLSAGADRLDAHRRCGKGGTGQPLRCGAGDGRPGGRGVGRGHPGHGGADDYRATRSGLTVSSAGSQMTRRGRRSAAT